MPLKEDLDDAPVSGGETSPYPVNHSNNLAEIPLEARRTEPNVPAPFSRKRTYSTPYPFDAASEPPRQPSRPPFRPPRVLRSSSAALPPPTSIPSRIPKPRTRAGSLAKATGNGPSISRPVLPLSTDGNNVPFDDFQLEMSPIESPEAGRYTAEDALVSRSDDAHEVSVTQAQFEHWYRGEGREGGGRNGGKGEIRAGTQEMLAIALSGHVPTDYRPRESWAPALSTHLDDGEYSDSQERWRTGALAQDSVLDERMLTDMEGDGEGTDADTLGGPSTPTLATSQLPNAQPPHSTPRRRAVSSIRTQTTPTQSRMRSSTKPIGQPGQSSPAGSDRLSSSANRARPTGGVPRKTSSPPPINSSASRSAYDLSSFSALADAIPQWEPPPPIPPSGNWDEVILPTIAKKMRMAQSGPAPEAILLGFESTSRPQAGSPQPFSIPPAPGTFAYDASKAYPRSQTGDAIDMQQFGARDLELQPAAVHVASPPSVAREAAPQPNITVTAEQTPNVPQDQLLKAAPDLRKNKPAIRVTSPSLKSQRVPEDEHDGGCCKCVVM